jgi:hypothetical protein
LIKASSRFGYHGGGFSTWFFNFLDCGPATDSCLKIPAATDKARFVRSVPVGEANLRFLIATELLAAARSEKFGPKFDGLPICLHPLCFVRFEFGTYPRMS